MDSRYNRAFYYLLQNEGGYVDDPRDSGGATKYGISLKFLKKVYEKGSIWADINRDGRIDKNDIKDMDLDFAKHLYEKEFWENVRSISNDRLAIKVFDTAVNIGTVKAVKILQEILGERCDGIIGPKTLGAISTSNVEQIIAKYVDKLKNYYYCLACDNYPRYNAFLHGWLNRAGRIPL